MFILGDEGHYHGRFPWVTMSLIIINVVVFVAQAFLGEPFTNGFSLVPAEITSFRDLRGTHKHTVKIQTKGYHDHRGKFHPTFETRQFPINHYPGPFPICLTLFTAMFMHGDVFHLIGNMWFLLIFGRNVECALDHGRFLAFYIACGLFAALAHVASDLHSIIPCLGASGAISGVLGAYVSIHPMNKIKVWFGWWLGVVELPALVVIGIWFLLQYISAFLSLEHEGLGGVAYWCHLGGFLAGFLILRGIILQLQWQQANNESAKEELGDLPASAAPAANVDAPEQTGIKAGEPDPFATFLSIQAVRKVQDQHKHV